MLTKEKFLEIMGFKAITDDMNYIHMSNHNLEKKYIEAVGKLETMLLELYEKIQNSPKDFFDGKVDTSKLTEQYSKVSSNADGLTYYRNATYHYVDSVKKTCDDSANMLKALKAAVKEAVELDAANAAKEAEEAKKAEIAKQKEEDELFAFDDLEKAFGNGNEENRSSDIYDQDLESVISSEDEDEVQTNRNNNDSDLDIASENKDEIQINRKFIDSDLNISVEEDDEILINNKFNDSDLDAADDSIEVINIDLDDEVVDDYISEFDQSVFDAAGVKNYTELIASDSITDMNGKKFDIDTSNKSQYMAFLLNRSLNGELYINGNSYIQKAPNHGIVKAIGTAEYERMTKNICDSLADADPEDPAYNKFRTAVTELSNNLKANAENSSYDFKSLRNDMKASVNAATEYLKKYSEKTQAVSHERARAAMELLALAEKAKDENRHPMEKFDKEFAQKKQNAFHSFLQEHNISERSENDLTNYLYYYNGKKFTRFLPENYKDMTPENFNKEIVPKLESGQVYLREKESKAIKRVDFTENVFTKNVKFKVGEEINYKGNINEEQMNKFDDALRKLNKNNMAVDVKPKNLSTKNQFTKILEKLEKAKTRFGNSDQYEGIIKMVKFANKTDKWENGQNLTDEQRYVTQLLAIKNSINKYINHKAKDGVNKNVYKKLAAVEELNKMINEKIDEVDFKPFNYAGTTIKREDYQLGYGEEVEMSNFNRIRGNKFSVPVMIGREAMEDQKNAISNSYPNANVNEMMNTDGCMCRILLSALNHENVSEKKINDLLKMRTEFLNNPAEKIAPVANNEVNRVL